MPRGRPQKVQPENEIKTETTVAVPFVPVEVFHVETVPTVPVKALTPDQIRIQESRKSLSAPLGPGQKFFETPDGEIIIGEAEKDHVWCRRLKSWVNPRR